LEPISPELALIDPELARADLVRLSAQELPPAARQVPERVVVVVQRTWALRTIQALLLVSLLVNGAFVADVAARIGSDRPVLLTSAAVAADAVPAPASVVSPAAQLEQRVLAMVMKSPRRHLPPALIDSGTGLPRNNLQAVCRPATGADYLCVVRPAQHRPGEGLYVRFRPSSGGPDSFAWMPYRPG
jgi:hypothetical protein